MSDFLGAKCVGLHWLFDSTLTADHEEAARRCAECPAIAACRQRLTEQRAPRGTWAGPLADDLDTWVREVMDRA